MRTPARKNYEDSCRFLQSIGWLDTGAIPPMSPGLPGIDDESPGITFFRTRVEELSLQGLSLPRTFFGRSLIMRCEFVDCDMSESNFCWNDWENVEFANSDLSRCDMRRANFSRVSFHGATLHGADLRLSVFRECDFTNANLTAAAANPDQRASLLACGASVSQIQWKAPDGKEPPGG